MHSWGIKQLKTKTLGDDSDRSGSMASFGGQKVAMTETAHGGLQGSKWKSLLSVDESH